MKEKYLEYLYNKVINENVFFNPTMGYITQNQESSETNKEIKKTFSFDFIENNKNILAQIKNKSYAEIEESPNRDQQLTDFLDGKFYLYEVSGTKRSFYFINDKKIYCGKFIDIPNGENDLYEIIFAQTSKLKTKDIKETEKLNLSIANIKVLSKIYLIIVTCPYFKRENNSVFYFSTIENSNFKSNIKDKSETEKTIESYIDSCQTNIKKEIKDFTELVHENDINEVFKKLRADILDITKTAKIKNKIYENFMNSVESNLNVKLNKYTFNYRRKGKIKVCVAFSKNKSVDDIQKTIESADHKFKNN